MLPPGGAITRPLQDVTVAESQTAELECEVANANAEGKWLKEGHSVDFSENVVSEVKGAVRRLIIVITRPQDVGEYSYQVANSKTTANLRVEGKLPSTHTKFLCRYKNKTYLKMVMQDYNMAVTGQIYRLFPVNIHDTLMFTLLLSSAGRKFYLRKPLKNV